MAAGDVIYSGQVKLKSDSLYRKLYDPVGSTGTWNFQDATLEIVSGATSSTLYGLSSVTFNGIHKVNVADLPVSAFSGLKRYQVTITEV